MKASAGNLTILADNGSSMDYKLIALLLEDLGVAMSHSRSVTVTHAQGRQPTWQTAEVVPLQH